MIDDSKVFCDSQIKEIKKRLSGDYSDKTGLFSKRIRPKLIEIQKTWIPHKKIIDELLKDRRGRK